MNARNIGTVYLKELRDWLRDRRTLISVFIVPTLVIPVILLGFGLVTAKFLRKARAEVSPVMLIGAEDSPAVHAAVLAHARIKVVPATPDFRQQISDKKIRAAIEIPSDFDARLARNESATVKIYTYEGEMRAGFAAGDLERFFRDYRETIVQSRLTERGVPVSVTKPFLVTRQNVAPPEKVGGAVIGGFIPYLIILLCFAGAMYPAIDLTAGEKERGTMETLLCSPIARIDIVLGKFLVVLTAALATVVLAGLSGLVTLPVGGLLMAKTSVALPMGGPPPPLPPGGPAALLSIHPLGFLAALGMILPVAVLFAAGLFTIALFAKTYKEAQSYVSPLIIVIILPAVAALLPGVELNTRLALVPILNVSLACKELVSGVFNWPYLALIFGSTCAYAALALALAVRMFNRESVLFRT